MYHPMVPGGSQDALVYVLSCVTDFIVGTIPGGYVRGRPVHIYRVNATPVPLIRTKVAPEM